ncbi:hypothetical protein LMF32_06885 [Desemzia sp. C1]|uniref:hypothetical protein n=1 Tax=Desemzia sp. C1 TaxID=2892016 RepID=UPI001E64E0F1|nr:hypothetical protein [Desemzia sp. C1]MCI3028821.1 hypothetical protein [Desemzia sp. C1]
MSRQLWQVRGSFIGNDSRYTRTEFAKAVVEGEDVSFSLIDSQVLMDKHANKQFEQIVSVD